NKNFSEQDAPGAIDLYYDRPERPSISDQQTIEWRKMVLSAPELNLRKPPRDKDAADRAFAVAQSRTTKGARPSNGQGPNGASGNGHGPNGASGNGQGPSPAAREG